MAVEWYTDDKGCYAVRNYNARGNKQIWRLTQYIYENIIPPWEGVDYMSWTETAQSFKDQEYDKAAELLKKIQMNEFTGPDDHD